MEMQLEALHNATGLADWLLSGGSTPIDVEKTFVAFRAEPHAEQKGRSASLPPSMRLSQPKNTSEGSRLEIGQGVRQPWSVGSALHAAGTCRPCAWYHKEAGCSQGAACKYCHLCKDGVFHLCSRERKHQKYAAALKGWRVMARTKGNVHGAYCPGPICSNREP